MKDERGPGLDFSLWLYFEFVYFIIKVFECSLVPTSSFPYTNCVTRTHTHRGENQPEMASYILRFSPVCECACSSRPTQVHIILTSQL